MSRFEKFNEMLFESYCKKAVSNAAKKERQKKAARGLMEQSLSELLIWQLNNRKQAC